MGNPQIGDRVLVEGYIDGIDGDGAFSVVLDSSTQWDDEQTGYFTADDLIIIPPDDDEYVDDDPLPISPSDTVVAMNAVAAWLSSIAMRRAA